MTRSFSSAIVCRGRHLGHPGRFGRLQPGENMNRLLTAVVSVIVAAGLASCGGSGGTTTTYIVSSTSTVTNTATGPASSTSSSSTAQVPAAKPQTFTGTGTENLGTINVPVSSELVWSCPTCGNANFQIFNNSSDTSHIAVNALDQTSGQTYVDSGTYSDVTINTEGQGWSFTITPSGQTPQAPPSVPPTPAPAPSGSNVAGPLPNQCDQNISTSPGVSCPFAENTFYEYWKATGGDPIQPVTIQAWSSASQQYYTETCSPGDGVVDCLHGNGYDVRFSQNSITAYTSTEASAYAAAAHLGPNG